MQSPRKGPTRRPWPLPELLSGFGTGKLRGGESAPADRSRFCRGPELCDRIKRHKDQTDMQRSETSIRTSHCGRLPAVSAATTSAVGAGFDSASPQVVEVIKKQVQIGIDCVGAGEFWNGRNFLYYGQQLSGVTARGLQPGERGSGREETRERDAFPKLYADMDHVGTRFCVPGEEPRFFPSQKKMVAT